MRVLVALCLLVTLVAVTEGAWGNRRRGSSRFSSRFRSRSRNIFGNRARGADSIFSRFSSKVKKPMCQFDVKGVPQYSWDTKEKLCFNDKDYPYTQAMRERVDRALDTDDDAFMYMSLIRQGYINNAMNNTGYNPVTGIRYKDLCSEEGRLLERIWWTNTITGKRGVCYVIEPFDQGIYVPLGGGNCYMDTQAMKHHYCVPDGFVDRDIYVFCPDEFKQCRRTTVTVPTGCSCKKYDCLKYTVV